MNNPMKLIFGSLIGAGIGVVLSKAIESQQEPGLTAASALIGDQPSETEPGEDFKERLARARSAGAVAREEKEAELRSLFRQKVQRTNALADVESSD
jgi:hypothetical protein